MNHRGRIQSQGGGIEDSESWCQKNNFCAVDGKNKTDKLESRHNKTEKKLRAAAFDKARKFIQDAKKKGGVSSVVKKSYLVMNGKAGRRIDIEVLDGIAFVSCDNE